MPYHEHQSGTLSRIAVHPIKALDPSELAYVAISEIGGLANDRAYAIVDSDGEYLNGKRTSAVHRLRASYELEANTVTLQAPESTAHQFHLQHDRDELESFLSEYFETEIALQVEAGGGLTDGAIYGDGTATGPTLISEATLHEMASWYDDISAEEMRLRLRPNLVIADVPAFWEDRLVANGGKTVRVGGVRLVGTKPIPRCVVPTRDPCTGETDEEFQRTLVEKREETLPKWAPRERFDHFLKVMVGLEVTDDEKRGELRVGDSVENVEP